MSETINTKVESVQTRNDLDAIAPAGHTSIVILFLLGLVALSMHVGREGGVRSKPNRTKVYIVAITAEWLIVAFITVATKWRGVPRRTLVYENSPRWRLILRDFCLAVAFLIAANTLVFLLSCVFNRSMHPATNEAMKFLLPRSRWESAVFLLIALTAGICEEIIFRGYLQRQFTFWTKSAAVGMIVQGVAFGLAHAYQGSAQVILIAVYGCLFGMLAYWRKSLRPGMLAHFLQDGIGEVLLARFLFK